MWLLIVFLAGVAFYLIPAYVANRRHHQNYLAILVTNIFLGWTALGWILALIWACTSNVRSVGYYDDPKGLPVWLLFLIIVGLLWLVPFAYGFFGFS